MLLRHSVLEQSTEDLGGNDPFFFRPSQFSGSNVKPIASNGARDHVPTAARRSQGVVILIQ